MLRAGKKGSILMGVVRKGSVEEWKRRIWWRDMEKEEARAVERCGSLGLAQQRRKWNQVKVVGKQQRRKIGRSCALGERRKISHRDKDKALPQGCRSQLP